jgi:hypothetical protein
MGLKAVAAWGQRDWDRKVASSRVQIGREFLPDATHPPLGVEVNPLEELDLLLIFQSFFKKISTAAKDSPPISVYRLTPWRRTA